MSDEKQLTLYAEDNATNLINQYDQEFQAYKSSLNLPLRDRRLVTQRSFAVTKVLIGSFLAISAVSLVLGSNYLDYRVQAVSGQSNQEPQSQAWVFPVYFIAGVFSVSSVLAFKKAIR
jgi:hypothetical protein